jgi:hypothetical protein
MSNERSQHDNGQAQGDDQDEQEEGGKEMLALVIHGA